jgi:hypothetical protein
VRVYVCVLLQLCYDLVLRDVDEVALFTWAVRLVCTEARHGLRSAMGPGGAHNRIIGTDKQCV